jgi:hypothetical protein
VGSESWRSAWVDALDALDADVAAIESMLAEEHRIRDLPQADPWSPPAGMGPLPLDLRPRADAILARQASAAQQLIMAIASNRRQAAFVAKVEVGDFGKAPPAYVDRAM